jgi:Ca-activated chloride channel family protein
MKLQSLSIGAAAFGVALLAACSTQKTEVDAGEIGAGHRVTTLYEIALVGSDGGRVKALRYGNEPRRHDGAGKELAFLRLRYKQPIDGASAASRLIEALARGARDGDNGGYAGEFLQLVAQADSLGSRQGRAEE